MQKSNFHTHSIYSDGHNTVREMIEEAISRGFTALGMSDHSFVSDSGYSIESTGKENEYFAEVRALSEEYSERIKVYCGIEYDAISDENNYDHCDYRLCSLHDLVVNGKRGPIDSSRETHLMMINDLYGGDALAMCVDYYEKMAEHIKSTKADIVGHFDLVTKFGIAPESHPNYIEAAISSMRKIVPYCDVFELNTGAIARGLRTVPYPAPFLMRELKQLGGRVVITSDCHYREKLTVWFDDAEKYLESFGFRCDENASVGDVVRGVQVWG